MRQAITVSKAAIEQVRTLLQKREKPSVGIRIGLKTKGCNGLAYSIEYADEKQDMDESARVNQIAQQHQDILARIRNFFSL